jgi:alanyl-tRNA synthetase
MKSFVLVTEEAISKGIRRIVAITGPDAVKAQKKCEALENQLGTIKKDIESKAANNTLNVKESSQDINRLNEVSVMCFDTSSSLLLEKQVKSVKLVKMIG